LGTRSVRRARRGGRGRRIDAPADCDFQSSGSTDSSLSTYIILRHAFPNSAIRAPGGGDRDDPADRADRCGRKDDARAGTPPVHSRNRARGPGPEGAIGGDPPVATKACPDARAGRDRYRERRIGADGAGGLEGAFGRSAPGRAIGLSGKDRYGGRARRLRRLLSRWPSPGLRPPSPRGRGIDWASALTGSLRGRSGASRDPLARCCGASR
jgi:hypothetical protein